MRLPAARFFLAASLLCASLCLQGCAMYSETRDKQAIAAKEAWKKVDLAGQLTAARKEEATVLAEQLRTEDALKRAARDTTALALILDDASIKGGLLAGIQADVELLAGKHAHVELPDGSNRATMLLDALDDQASLQRFLQKVESEFTRFGLEMPSCAGILDESAKPPVDAWIAANPRVGSAVKGAWSVAKEKCKALSAAKDKVKGTLGGALATTTSSIDTSTNQLKDNEKAGVDQRNRYRAAAKELDTALQDLEADPHGAREKVDAALGRVKSLVAALEKLPDAYSAKFLSEERAKSLNTLVATVEQARRDGSVPQNADTAARVLIQFPDLFDKARAALADAQKPRLAPLVLMKNLEKVRVDAAARDVASQQAMLGLLREQFNWEVQRLRAVRDASDYLNYNCGDCQSWRLSDALRPVNESQLAAKDGMALVQAKANVLRAATLYLDARGRLAASASRTQYQINALEHERALAYAEGNVAQWNTLISSVVDQMSDYWASGIRKEDVAALVNSAALLWIGKGVN